MFCYIRGFDAAVHMVVEKTRKQRGLPHESDLEGFESIRRRLQDPEPVCVDPGVHFLHGKGHNHRHLRN
nr:hypothetical protein CFP56_46536 [Quercus suber]